MSDLLSLTFKRFFAQASIYLIDIHFIRDVVAFVRCSFDKWMHIWFLISVFRNSLFNAFFIRESINLLELLSISLEYLEPIMVPPTVHSNFLLFHLSFSSLTCCIVLIKQLSELIISAKPWFQVKVTTDVITDVRNSNSVAAHCQRFPFSFFPFVWDYAKECYAGCDKNNKWRSLMTDNLVIIMSYVFRISNYSFELYFEYYVRNKLSNENFLLEIWNEERRWLLYILSSHFSGMFIFPGPDIWLQNVLWQSITNCMADTENIWCASYDYLTVISKWCCLATICGVFVIKCEKFSTTYNQIEPKNNNNVHTDAPALLIAEVPLRQRIFYLNSRNAPLVQNY